MTRIELISLTLLLCGAATSARAECGPDGHGDNGAAERAAVLEAGPRELAHVCVDACMGTDACPVHRSPSSVPAARSCASHSE